MSWAQLIPQIAVWAGIVCAIAAVIAIVPMTRQFMLRGWRLLMLLLGRPGRRYARWFVRELGVYDNPYLDTSESLDLRNTYVPLSFRSGDEARETVAIATDVLAEVIDENLIIYGGPGSGKSTLLKAYGVGIQLDLGRWWSGGPQVVPFFVQLRKLARFLNDGRGLAEYLIDHILVAQTGMPQERASDFLRFSLKYRHVVVMLDGLDEVTTECYEAVRLAVFDFIGDHNPDRPTYRARAFLTCRRQNFTDLRDDWVPGFSEQECSLAPLRNSEIYSYLDKTRGVFKVAGGPEKFMQAVRASGTLDLHRIPLILAMSVGLYARRDYFEIPASIAELYKAMIREMLDRHSFRRDPGGRALRFQADDKYRFLREFALYAAEQPGGLDEFAKSELMQFAARLAPQLNAVRDPEAMVGEVIERSGLLTDVSESLTYVFAHRSIHEFLVAEQLRIAADGSQTLLGKAANPGWRQVIQFYSAGQEQQQIDGFLRRLAEVNPELAGYCLAGAKTSDQVAADVLDALEPVDESRIPALAAATLSPRVPVQELAVQRLYGVLSIPGNAVLSASADVDGMLPFLNSLARANDAEIAALVPRVIAEIPDDPRLVEPLWRCLMVAGIEQLPECNAIVRRLLSLVMEPNSLAELSRQAPQEHDFLTADVRWRAYPFARGIDPEHNLVTLLAWAELLGVTPMDPNRFFQAKAAACLPRIEPDLRRTVAVSLFSPTRLLTALLLPAAAALTLYIAFKFPKSFSQNQSFAATFGLIWHALPLLFEAAGIGCAIIGFYLTLPRLFRRNPGVRDFLRPVRPRAANGNLIYALCADKDDGPFYSQFVWFPLSWAIIARVVDAASTAEYAVVTSVAYILFTLTATRLFSRPYRYYLRRPNAFVDVYEDPRSRLWLGRPGPTLELADEIAPVSRPAEVP